MVKLELDGVEKIAKAFSRMTYTDARKIVKFALYPGAGLVLDAVRGEIESEHSRTGALAESAALGKMKTVGDTTKTMVKYVGYDEKGVANEVKARALESGTSDGRITATHFATHAADTVKDAAIAAMQTALDEKIGQIVN